MSLTTGLLYFVVFGLWAFFIRREGGIGIGFRFLYGCGLVMYFLVGPALAELFGSSSLRIVPQSLNDAVRLSLLGTLAYLVGGYLVFPWLIGQNVLLPNNLQAILGRPSRLNAQWKCAWALIIFGILSLPLYSQVRSIPSLGAVFATLPKCTHTGIVMLCLYAHLTKRWQAAAGAFGVLAVMGILHTATTGHAGWIFFVGMFATAIMGFATRLRAKTLVATVIVGLAAFILAQMWLSERERLREAIRENQSFQQRADIAIDIFSNSSPMSKFQTQEDWVAGYQGRGDFSTLMASALEHTPSRQPFAGGETFLDAFIAVVPRILWPDKPYEAGGNAFVSRYTGIIFGKTTSVGMNYMFELYINFGQFGTVLGMFLVGLIFAWIEHYYYKRAAADVDVEYKVLLLAWALCLYSDTLAIACMTVVPVIILSMILRWIFSRTILIRKL